MTPLQFMILAQFIFVILGGRWSGPSHRHLHADLHPALGALQRRPLFFGLLVALNCRRPSSRRGGDGGVLPEGRRTAARHAQPDLRRHDAVLGIQVLALILLYMFPDIGLWLPKVLYN